MMEKQEQNRLIIGFLEGELNSAEEMQLLKWVNENQSNRDLFLKQQSLFEDDFIKNKSQHSIESWKRLQAKIALPPQQKPVFRLQNKQLRKVVAIAAAFVFGFVVNSLVSKTWLPDESVQTVQTVTTPYGARTQFLLPDSSTVWMNAGSKLSYSSEFAENRQVALEGEAFFDVRKGRPFVVSTSYGDVQVKGTSFDVKAFPDEAFETTLVTGLVQIKGNKTGEEILLQPGFQAKEEGGKLVVNQVATELFTSWKEGKLIFNKEYLPVVIKSLERWYNIHIKLDDDPQLSKIYFSGTLEMESFPEVMELLKTTASIDYTFDEKSRTVKIIKK